MPARNLGTSRAKKTNPEITRVEILRKYWELANLDPEATKGTITGQLKALELLAGQLEMQTNLVESQGSQAEIYRAAWLDRAASSSDLAAQKKAREQ